MMQSPVQSFYQILLQLAIPLYLIMYMLKEANWLIEEFMLLANRSAIAGVFVRVNYDYKRASALLHCKNRSR
jgi:hypothetical protein